MSPHCPETEIAHRGDGRRLPAIYNQLTTCPNITSLDLDMTAEGCVVFSDPYRFQFQEGDRFPALKKLSLERYDAAATLYDPPRSRWDDSWKRWAQRKAIDVLRFAGMRQDIVTAWTETNLDKWLRAMDFSQIEELHLAQRDDVFYERMGNKLPSLRSLSMKWSASNPTHVDFLRAVPPLRQLSITLTYPCRCDSKADKPQQIYPLQEILARHGTTLESLALKRYESQDAANRRPMLSLSELHDIRERCPNLTTLVLDIHRDAATGWPHPTFDALMQIETLTNLTLRLELGADLHVGEGGWMSDEYLYGVVEDPGPFREPRMNRRAAEALFAYLRERKQGAPLREVVFELGDWHEKAYMGPLAHFGWTSGRAREFACVSVDQEVDGAGMEEMGVRCRVIGDAYPGEYADPDEAWEVVDLRENEQLAADIVAVLRGEREVPWAPGV